MAERNYWVLCDDNCRFPAMTKEQILTAIAQAVSEGTVGDIDAGFIQTIKTINGVPLRFFYGKQYEYEALTDEEKENLFAIITNDTTKEGIEKAIETLRNDLNSVDERLSEAIKGIEDGNIIAGYASRASNSNNASYLTIDTLYANVYQFINEIGLYAVEFTSVSYPDTILTVMLSITDLSRTVYAPNAVLGNKTYSCFYNGNGVVSVAGEGADNAELHRVYQIARYI